MKVCKQCKEEKGFEFFYFRDERGAYRSICKNCTNINSVSYRKKNRQKKRDFVNSFKQRCEKCGETRHYMLEFHHKDSSKKEFTIGDFMYSKGSTREGILKEIEKCVVLCANHHREYHYLERSENISLASYLEQTHSP